MYIVKINGVYDIVCGLCILHDIPYLGTIHLNMIKNHKTNVIFQRYYAYWILTYGYMRLTSHIKMSYWMEAFCTANELYHNDIDVKKAVFVIMISLLIGIAL